MDDPLVIKQGEYNEIAWDITDDNGQPATLNGYAAFLQVRRRMDPKSTIMYDLDPSILESSVVVVVEALESYELGFVGGFGTLILMDNGGRTEALWSGRVEVQKSATDLRSLV